MSFKTVLQMEGVLEKAPDDRKTDINGVLPAEMLLLTFLHLSPGDLEAVQEVCRLWQRVAYSACRELDRLDRLELEQVSP